MKAWLFIVSMLICPAIWGHVLHVGEKRQYKNITTGFAAARHGDTILVDAGHYKEKNLVITKSITVTE